MSQLMVDVNKEKVRKLMAETEAFIEKVNDFRSREHKRLWDKYRAASWWSRFTGKVPKPYEWIVDIGGEILVVFPDWQNAIKYGEGDTIKLFVSDLSYIERWSARWEREMRE